MPVGLQGAWIVSVTSKSASWAQQFRLAGSTADMVYPGTPGTTVVANGDQWGITVEHDPSGPTGWRESRYRLDNFGTSGGFFHFEIRTDDGGGSDEDFNDLVLTCQAPLSSGEWFVYGTVKSYRGFCLNPCFGGPWVAIDSKDQLIAMLADESVRPIVEKLYPERVRAALTSVPQVDQPEFRPMLIPTGQRSRSGLMVRGATELDVGEAPPKGRREPIGDSYEVTDTASTVVLSDVSPRAALSDEDLIALGSFRDRVFPICTTERLGEVPLRFVEYDRTAAEAAGAPYLGDGDRETLGMTLTDEFGNYVFRFDRTGEELVAESDTDPDGSGLPDLLLQVMDELPEGVAWESAPYYNVPNVKRIDLCIPEGKLDPFEQPCQGGRAIQFLGDIAIFPNSHSELHSNPIQPYFGTVTNRATAPAGPTVDHAAWWASIAVEGCFDDPDVKHFTLEYTRPGDTGWSFVNDPYDHWKKLETGAFATARVGPHPRPLGPGGSDVPAYINIEDDSDWIIGHRHRKLFLNTRRYQPDYGLATFRIQGYDDSNNPVPSAVDTFALLVDNRLSTGAIEFVKLPGEEDPGECALLGLASNSDPIQVRFRVDDPQGFLLDYQLAVTRGAGTGIPLAGGPVSDSYDAVWPFRFQGTGGYVTATVTPAAGHTWLPAGHDFCAFSFHVSASDRLTNGRSVPGRRTLGVELVGMTLESGDEPTP